MSIRLGLKLRADNIHLIHEAQELYEQKLFNYAELAVPLGSLAFLRHWPAKIFPYIIHAAHSGSGANPAQKELFAQNKAAYNEAIAFADRLQADLIIAHPGLNGSLDESARQLKTIFNNDERLAIENKPSKGLLGERCLGSQPSDIAFLQERLQCGFCLDFGHAWHAAVSLKTGPIAFIANLNKLKPILYHMTDGCAESETDSHLPYGSGNLPLTRFLQFLPENARLTCESARQNPNSLQEFKKDSLWLKKNLALYLNH